MTPEEQKELDSRLSNAARKGSTEDVRRLIAQGANVHAGDDDALFSAARNGYTETVKVLLTAGANVHADDDFALCLAANNDRMETVKVLLAAGANVHARDDWALWCAAYDGHTEKVPALAGHIFAPDSWRGKTRAEIEAYACGLYEKIKSHNHPNSTNPEQLHKAATILVDCALTCWEQVRPRPPKLTISPLPAQPRPL